MAFLVMGSFVTVYNYLAFSLEGPPWELSPSVVSWVFLLYTVGVFTSPVAGRLSDRVGRPRVLMAGALLQLAGAVATLVVPLPLKLLGLALFTLGFFTAHAVASTGVGPPGRSGDGRRVGALPSRLLRGFERGRHARRARLRARRVGRGRGARLGAPWPGRLTVAVGLGKVVRREQGGGDAPDRSDLEAPGPVSTVDG